MKTIWPEHLKGAELFRFLVANKSAVLEMKKSATKHADVVSLPALTTEKVVASKSFAFANDDAAGKLIRTIAMNTYNWMDSHDDVHLNNLFAKSLNERGSKIPHLHDHEFKLSARVGMPISWSETVLPWSQFGVEKSGDTMALLLESEISKELNKSVYKAYKNNQIDQHSVGMQYVKLSMAINDADYEDEYKVWKEVIDKIGNPQAAEAQGYFFAVREAKLLEGSAVLLGSNELTPVLFNDKSQPHSTVDKSKPGKPLNITELVKSYM